MNGVEMTAVELKELGTRIRTFTMSYLTMLLDEPDSVDLTIDPTQTVLKIVIKFKNDKDCGRMIGTAGKTVNGYRRLLYGVAGKYGIPRVSVMLVDPTGSPTGDQPDNYRRNISTGSRRPPTSRTS